MGASLRIGGYIFISEKAQYFMFSYTFYPHVTSVELEGSNSI